MKTPELCSLSLLRSIHSLVAVVVVLSFVSVDCMMKLEQFPIIDYIDRVYENSMREAFREKKCKGQLIDDVCHHAILVDSGVFECKTKGEKEFVLFTVFLAKVRRDNGELAGSTEIDRNKLLSWFNLAQAFIDDFGNRTPPDVVAAHQSFKVAFDL